MMTWRPKTSTEDADLLQSAQLDPAAASAGTSPEMLTFYTVYLLLLNPYVDAQKKSMKIPYEHERLWAKKSQ